MELQQTIEAAFDDIANVTADTKGDIRAAVETALALLDRARCAWPSATAMTGGHEWLKKAVLLSFRLNDMKPISGNVNGASWWDKVDSKFNGWQPEDFAAAGFRAVPNCVVRHSAYIAPGVVLMPSLSISALMLTAAQWLILGRRSAPARKSAKMSYIRRCGHWRCAGTLQASPVIIEDNCFIGARSEVAEGVIVREARFVDGGFPVRSTKIIDRAGGTIYHGEVPAYSVVVPAACPTRMAGHHWPVRLL